MLSQVLVFLIIFCYLGSTASALTQAQKDSIISGARYFNTEEDGALSSACAPTSSTSPMGTGTSGGSFTLDQLKAFARQPITSTWNISDSTVEKWFLSTRTPTIGKYGLTTNNIGQITSVVKAAGVSPVFFYAYTVSEGGGAGGFINHFGDDVAGGGVANAKRDAEYLADQSKIMTSKPSWYDAGNPVYFVPQDVQAAGNADFQNMPSGTIGRAYIPATAAATWEVYYPNGLKEEYNKVQNYGAPLENAMQNIKTMGGDPFQGGTTILDSTSCTPGAVAGEGITKAINWAVMIAKNDGYGYDLGSTRATGWVNWNTDPNCTDSCGNFDCSSLVSAALTEAGYFDTNPNFNTSTEAGYLEKAGFTNVTSSITLPSGAGLQPGDILLNIQNHTAIYIGDGQMVAAHSAYGNLAFGDQNGKEISVGAYSNYPWDAVYRATK